MIREVTAHAESSKGRIGFRIRFYDLDGKRRAIWLNKATASIAEAWRSHVAELLLGLQDNRPPCMATSRWASRLEPRLRFKLETVGLVAPISKPALQKQSAPMELNAFIEWYLGRRKNVKESTKETWLKTQGNLIAFFGADCRLDSIKKTDAAAWRDWLANEGNIREGKTRKDKNGNETRGRTSLADNTVRRRTGIAKQFFHYAIDSKLITENPFTGLAASVHGNESRQFFIDSSLLARAIEAAPNAEWKAIIGLARIGGLRSPSEVMRLKWEDIDFANGRLCIHASKTEHHRNGGLRFCPLFPELRPFLEDLAEIAKHRGAGLGDWVISQNRGSSAYLRTGFTRILKRAGIKPWPKLFHNLRASRETELLDEFPIKDVCSWIGNTQAIAMKHYAMMRESSFTRAAGLAAPFCGPAGGPEFENSGGLGTTPANLPRDPETKKPQVFPRVVYSGGSETSQGNWYPMGEEGLEPPTSTL